MSAHAHALISAPADQWLRALDRAIAESIDILVEPISGQTFAEASSGHTLYIVTPTSCTCEAGTRGRICKHVACLLHQTGQFPVPLPVAEDVVLAETTAPACPHCSAGRVEEWTAGHVSGSTRCSECGTGETR